MILVVGANGMLGRDMMELLGKKARGVDAGEMDITSPASVQRVLSALRPRVVINCAAYTDVDGCETNRETAVLVNGDGVVNLATVTAEIGAKLVHISTDYIFDGSKRAPYLEDDKTNPLSVYGESKLAGELGAAINPDHLIVRTQWLYGIHGKNFVETMLSLGKERDELSVVNDQTGSPTWTVDLAKAIMALLDHGCSGIYHAANVGYCTWNDFARSIFDETDMYVIVHAMSTEQLNRPARRPLYSTLDCGKLVRDTGFCPQGWHDALHAYLLLRKTRENL